MLLDDTKHNSHRNAIFCHKCLISDEHKIKTWQGMKISKAKLLPDHRQILKEPLRAIILNSYKALKFGSLKHFLATLWASAVFKFVHFGRFVKVVVF